MNDWLKAGLIILVLLVLAIGIALLGSKEVPEEVFEPIKTTGESRAYITETLGLPCDCDTCIWENPMDFELPVDGNGYIGYPLVTKVTSEGGPILFSTKFDPNNGYFYEIQCDSELIEGCPDSFRISGETITSNPDYEDYINVGKSGYFAFETCKRVE